MGNDHNVCNVYSASGFRFGHSALHQRRCAHIRTGESDEFDERRSRERKTYIGSKWAAVAITH
jgi:hypothetical protein